MIQLVWVASWGVLSASLGIIPGTLRQTGVAVSSALLLLLFWHRPSDPFEQSVVVQNIMIGPKAL